MHDAITQIVLRQPDEATADLRAKLAAAVARLGAWTDASIDWTSEQFMASHAQRLASKANYELITETDADGKARKGWSFRWPEEQARWSQEQTSGLAAENTAFTRSLALRMAMDDEQKPVTVTVADAEAVLLATADASASDKTAMITTPMTRGSPASPPQRSSRASHRTKRLHHTRQRGRRSSIARCNKQTANCAICDTT